MDDAVRRLLNVYQSLTEAQKKEVLEDLRKTGTKGELKEDIAREIVGVVMGPLGGKCPYCGK